MISSKMFKFLIIILLIVIVAKTGLAISCWQCNSKIDSECADLPSGPQDISNLKESIRSFYVNCDSLNDSFTDKYKLCRKQEQTH